MNNVNVKAGGSGIGLGTLLTVTFVVLKLCGVISWSWWWVFAPIWIPIALVLFFLILGIIRICCGRVNL